MLHFSHTTYQCLPRMDKEAATLPYSCATVLGATARADCISRVAMTIKRLYLLFCMNQNAKKHARDG